MRYLPLILLLAACGTGGDGDNCTFSQVAISNEGNFACGDEAGNQTNLAPTPTATPEPTATPAA